eukprot:m.71733 g.71733  ORF g.71733 m.71733 type:complete len:1293 (-) comp24386_c0_seq1:191-4069(-)
MEKPTLAFKDVTCCSSDAVLVDRAIGKVNAGSITAVFGPSSGGKSMLLKLLAGRGDAYLSHVEYTGTMLMEGKRVTPQSQHAAYLPQTNDHMIGVLTVREIISYNLRLKDTQGLNKHQREQRVNEMIEHLHLEDCADSQIGTFYKAGISGGQKRRTAVAAELVYHPKLLCADEPTSGLDTTTAIQSVQYMKNIARKTNGGCILSIHQPNQELLSLFDNIILLVDGKTTFFGSLESAKAHFGALGVTTDFGDATPTEHYLLAMDTLFTNNDVGDVEQGKNQLAIDYPDAYRSSDLYARTVEEFTKLDSKQAAHIPGRAASWWLQFFVLVHRAFQIAKRDYALYYLQYVLQITYGILVGLIFFNSPRAIDDHLQEGFSAIVWICALNIYVFVFKSFYFATITGGYRHERSNHAYSATASSAAELALYMVLSCLYCVGWLIAYGLVGFPEAPIGFLLLLGYVTTFTAEAIPHFISQFTGGNIPLGLIWCQGVILLFFLFSAGIFIRDEKMPQALEWVKFLSPFEHACDAMMAAVYEHLEFTCPTFDAATAAKFNSSTTATCTDASGGFVYQCETASLNATDPFCTVDGTEVVSVFKKQSPEKWESLAYLLIVGIAFRLASLILQIYPPSNLFTHVQRMFRKGAEQTATLLRKKPKKDKPTDDVAKGQGRLSAAAVNCGTLIFRNVNVTLKKKLITHGKPPKKIASQISARVEGGRLLALMGPSGAGKTTLLNALSGMAPYANTSADYLSLGGVKFKKKNLGYVPQFDSLSPSLTVYETLLFAVQLRCVLSPAQCKGRVADLLHTVGLVGVKDSRVAKLSGGEQKILSIGVGLVSLPDVLFLDEPTTGLDSTAADAVVSTVKDIADMGRTVILTIHQPSPIVFSKIDDLLVLAKGRTAYFGSVADATAYFNDVGVPVDVMNEDGIHREALADQIINAVAEPHPKGDWGKVYEESSHGQRMAATLNDGEQTTNETHHPRPTATTKLYHLTRKLTLQYSRDPGAYVFRAMGNFVFGLFTGLLYYNTQLDVENLNEISAIAFFWSWAPLYFASSSIASFCQYRRECLNAYASDQLTYWQHCVAQFIASIPFNIVCAVLLMVPLHWLSQANMTFATFGYGLVICFSMGVLMDAVNLCVIEATNGNVMISVTLSQVILGSMFIFAGFFIKRSNMQPGLKWISYTIPLAYGLPGSLYSLLHGQTYHSINGDVSGDYLLHNVYKLEDLDDYGSYPYEWVCIAIVFAFLLAIRLQHFAMLWKNNRKLGSMDHFGSTNSKKDSHTHVKTSQIFPDERVEKQITFL